MAKGWVAIGDLIRRCQIGPPNWVGFVHVSILYSLNIIFPGQFFCWDDVGFQLNPHKDSYSFYGLSHWLSEANHLLDQIDQISSPETSHVPQMLKIFWKLRCFEMKNSKMIGEIEDLLIQNTFER